MLAEVWFQFLDMKFNARALKWERNGQKYKLYKLYLYFQLLVVNILDSKDFQGFYEFQESIRVQKMYCNKKQTVGTIVVIRKKVVFSMCSFFL